MKVYKQDDFELKTERYENLIKELYDLKAKYVAHTGIVPDTVELTPYDFKIIKDYFMISEPNRAIPIEQCRTLVGLNIQYSANRFIG